MDGGEIKTMKVICSGCDGDGYVCEGCGFPDEQCTCSSPCSNELVECPECEGTGRINK